MTRELAVDNTVLNALQGGDIDLEATTEFDAEYYVPVTQRHEFVQDFDKLGFDRQHNICEVLHHIDPEPVEIVSSPYGIAFGEGPHGGGDMPHYEEILEAMGGDDEHAWDALGVETTIVNDMEFVSADTEVIGALESYSPEHLLRQDEFKALAESERE